MRLPASDDELRGHLAHANLPSLLPAIAQLTGDLSLLSRFSPPATPMLGAVEGNFSQADQAAIRAPRERIRTPHDQRVFQDLEVASRRLARDLRGRSQLGQIEVLSGAFGGDPQETREALQIPREAFCLDLFLQSGSRAG